MKKTLYLSDLDGTLLRSNETLSQFTTQTINKLAQQGILFSYATARSSATAEKVTSSLCLRSPVIVHNGVFIWDSLNRKYLATNTFSYDESMEISSTLYESHIFPIVYTYSEPTAAPDKRCDSTTSPHNVASGQKISAQQYAARGEHFHYFSDPTHGTQYLFSGMRAFLETRRGDPRETPVTKPEYLLPQSTENPGGLPGSIYYYTCIDEQKKLAPIYERFKDRYSCVYSADFYTGALWLEIFPKSASKAGAALQLKTLLNCSRIVSFGDHLNDLSLFEISDACYAVENAVPELKEKATAIIPSNDQDGVAQWLLSHLGCGSSPKDISDDFSY